MFVILSPSPTQVLRRVERHYQAAVADLTAARLAVINAQALVAAHTHEVEQLSQLRDALQKANDAPSKEN